MKFSVDKERVVNEFQSLAAVADKKQTLPILSNILIRCEEDKVSLLSTDLEVELEIIIEDVNVESVGETTIPAKKTADIISALPEGQVSFQGNEEGTKLTVTSSSGTYNLSAIPGSDFPDFDVVKSDVIHNMSSAQLLELFHKTSHAMANGDWRHFLNGCFFEKTLDTVKMVATDSRRLAVYHSKLNTEGDFSCIIPRKTALELVKILPKKETEISFYINVNNIVVMAENFTFKSKLISGNYPRYKDYIPSGNNTSITVNRKDLIDTLARVSVLTSDKFKGVKLTAENGLLEVSAHNASHEAAIEELEVEGDSDSFDIGLNVNYFKEILNNVEDEKVTIAKFEDKVIEKKQTVAAFIPNESAKEEKKPQGVIIKTSDPNQILTLNPILI